MLIDLFDTEVGFVWDCQKDYPWAALTGSLPEVLKLTAVWLSKMCIYSWVTIVHNLPTNFMLHHQSEL